MGSRDLGWMALDLAYAAGMEAHFFRAQMVDGVIEVPALGDECISA
jgi:CRISPR-associated protein Cas5d